MTYNVAKFFPDWEKIEEITWGGGGGRGASIKMELEGKMGHRQKIEVSGRSVCGAPFFQLLCGHPG